MSDRLPVIYVRCEILGLSVARAKKGLPPMMTPEVMIDLEEMREPIPLDDEPGWTEAGAYNSALEDVAKKATACPK